MWPNPQFPANLVEFTEKIVDRKLKKLGKHSTILKKSAKFVCKMCLHTFS